MVLTRALCASLVPRSAKSAARWQPFSPKAPLPWASDPTWRRALFQCGAPGVAARAGASAAGGPGGTYRPMTARTKGAAPEGAGWLRHEQEQPTAQRDRGWLRS